MSRNREEHTVTNRLEAQPVVVIGAGPVGLAAAAHLAERGRQFLVLEAGDEVAAAVSEWGHVRLFSPWRYNIDAAARRLLEAGGWAAPDPDRLPTGAELADAYLRPLAKLPALDGRIRRRARVEAITRLGFDRVRSHGREAAPFLLRLADGEELLARAVIDASGAWRTPNALGGHGLRAPGEAAAIADELILVPLPDVLGADRDRFAGRRTVVVGAGHSAATTLLELAELGQEAPGTEAVWAIRGGSASRAYGGGEADQLPARGALGARLRHLVETGKVELAAGFTTAAVEREGSRIALVGAEPGQRLVADVAVNATGFRPDHTIASELRLDLDPILGATRALAPLIDPNQHSCGTVPPHGVDELTHPDPGYYAVGMKSYGRAPTFLLATGYEQVRSVVAAIAGDWDAARDVRLELPETGVCSSDLAYSGRGLGTGLSGGLRVLPVVDNAPAQGRCCG
ncbi:MAG: FAD-dependent oxidoreductase [Micromonosporaceae bacterium]|nr:FAD-dependent oxidoreductase [Micromonosporaceae bacterium]